MIYPKYSPEELKKGDTAPMTIDRAWATALSNYPDYEVTAAEDGFPMSEAIRAIGSVRECAVSVLVHFQRYIRRIRLLEHSPSPERSVIRHVLIVTLESACQSGMG